MNEKWNAYVKNMFKVGTAECAISFAVIAMVLAIMLLSGLFWKMLLVLALMLVGAFLGGVKDKKQFLLNIINRLFPPKNQIPYRERNPEIEQAIRKSKENQE